MTRRALLLCAALIATPARAGRHQILGSVIDRNGQPVNRAIVSLTPGNLQMMTDREGEFVIDYLRDEDGRRTRMKKRTTYALEVFKPGYHPKTLTLEYKRGTLELPVITLVEDSIEIDDVTENIDPGLFKDPTHSAGAAYEGQ